ncbi:DUF2971 domain-containing protein [Brucella pituitosa]|uniref:DUF2971 domain-containing protein n=1 Tax=Brucella pituitosa TaxID=571256 RepID=UPI0012FD1B20|nr:DUF2971 domain-containing protein [Brucella pituitosa]MCK4204742.1 DUF2971 domain-containing protein [Brucella pituitosa]
MQDIMMRCFSIFMPYAYKETQNVMTDDSIDFAHYTSAETLLKILDGAGPNNPPKIWMRNVRTMNDVDEIYHGYDRIQAALNDGGRNDRLKAAFESINLDATTSALTSFHSHWDNHLTHTYITCMTAHDELENKFGRLSMWRAYGKNTVGAAIILNKTPFFTPSDILGAYSSPVAYHTDEKLASEIDQVIYNIETNKDWLKTVDPECIGFYIFNMFSFGVTCLKHPGFREEKEWRIIFNPKMRDNGTIPHTTQSVDGAPQKIYTLEMKDIHIGEDSLTGISPDALIKRVIIGPSQLQGTVREAMIEALTKVGVTNAEKRVVLSTIPMRVAI